jgi:hypothetical protein
LDSTLITPIVTGGGVAGVFCILFVLGAIFPRAVVTDLKAEIAELKAALAAERETSKASITAASATKDILAAIQLGRDIGHEKAGP